MCESTKLRSSNEIFEFRRRCWHAAHDFVSADSGEQHPIPLRRQARFELGKTAVSSGWGVGKAICGQFGSYFEFSPLFRIFWTDVDVPSRSAALLLDFGEIGSLVPVR